RDGGRRRRQRCRHLGRLDPGQDRARCLHDAVARGLSGLRVRPAQGLRDRRPSRLPRPPRSLRAPSPELRAGPPAPRPGTMTTIPAEPVRSASNPRFRMLAGLVEKARDRRRHGAIVIEGAHLLEAWIARFGPPRLVFVPEDAPAPVGRLAIASGAEVLALD